MVSQNRLISFDESVLDEAERHLAESGGSLSAFVNSAVLHKLQVIRGRELLAEDGARLGPMSSEGRTQVSIEWPA